MSMKGLGISHKEIEPQLVTCIRLVIQKRTELALAYEKLEKECQAYICGPPLLVYHEDTGARGFDVEACIPVNQAVKTNDIASRILERIEVLTKLHKGPPETISETQQKIYGFTREHGIMSALTGREKLSCF